MWIITGGTWRKANAIENKGLDYPYIVLKHPKKATSHIHQGSCCPGRRSKIGPKVRESLSDQVWNSVSEFSSEIHIQDSHFLSLERVSQFSKVTEKNIETVRHKLASNSRVRVLWTPPIYLQQLCTRRASYCFIHSAVPSIAYSMYALSAHFYEWNIAHSDRQPYNSMSRRR